MEQKVKEQIIAIRDTGLTNMFDVITVQRLAYERNYFELVTFIEEHKNEYRDDARYQQSRVDHTQDKALEYTTRNNSVQQKNQSSELYECPVCGSKMKKAEKFCPECGTKMD